MQINNSLVRSLLGTYVGDIITIQREHLTIAATNVYPLFNPKSEILAGYLVPIESACVCAIRKLEEEIDRVTENSELALDENEKFLELEEKTIKINDLLWTMLYSRIPDMDKFNIELRKQNIIAYVPEPKPKLFFILGYA